MTSRMVVGAVRAWTRMYTAGLDPIVRENRQAEIESDLWEFFHDPDVAPNRSIHLLSRFVLGVPDDLRWRGAQEWSNGMRTIVVMMVAASLLVASAWNHHERQLSKKAASMTQAH